MEHIKEQPISTVISYKKKDLLELVTSDGEVIVGNKHTLKLTYELIANHLADCPDATSIDLVITSSDLELLMIFVDAGVIPTSDEDWIRLLQAADYMWLASCKESYLDIAVSTYIKKKGGQVHCKCTNKDYIVKINNPNFLSQAEEKKIREEEEREIQRLEKEKKELKERIQRNGPIGLYGYGLQGFSGPTGPSGCSGASGPVYSHNPIQAFGWGGIPLSDEEEWHEDDENYQQSSDLEDTVERTSRQVEEFSKESVDVATEPGLVGPKGLVGPPSLTAWVDQSKVDNGIQSPDEDPDLIDE